MLNLKAVLLIRITRQVEGTPNTLKNHEKILLIVFLTKIIYYYFVLKLLTNSS